VVAFQKCEAAGAHITLPINIPVNTNPHPLTDANAAYMRRCFRRACPSDLDEHDTPDMSEVARIAWAGTQTIRWPQPTKEELTMVTLDHTARTHTRVPTEPLFVLLHRRSYCTASGHTGQT
jgi:hypothetical protein